MLEVERVKILLSSHDEANLVLPNKRDHLVTRNLFLQAINAKLHEIRQPIEQCLADLSIGSGGIDQLIMVGGSSKIPAARQLVAELLGKEPAAGVDPMTAVAEGAAIASAILLGQLDKDFFVATEHALGTIVHDETHRASFSVLIPRNHQLPAKASDVYFPLNEGQESVRVEVLEGDPAKPVDHEDNVVLKEWTIAVDPTRTKQDAAFTITYEYDVDGILHITVLDKLTGAVMLKDDVSYGVSKDKTQLVEVAKRVHATIEAGSVNGRPGPGAPARQVVDPHSAALLQRARDKVIPFIDDEEAARIESLCADLEHATGDAVSDSRENLASTLRQYAYLL
jgi:molecular chaperone DnaK (HSP70)